MSDVRASASASSGQKSAEDEKMQADPYPQVGEFDASSSVLGLTKVGGIDSMFDHLVIGEDEFDDFVIDEEDEEVLMENTRWMAVARVLIDKKFSHEALFLQMQNAWNPAREIKMRAVGENRFVIQ
jgi:hypothetical protein